MEKVAILHKMAAALLKYETLDSEQIKDIMEGREPREPKDWVESDKTKPRDPKNAKDKEEGTIHKAKKPDDLAENPVSNPVK